MRSIACDNEKIIDKRSDRVICETITLTKDKKATLTTYVLKDKLQEKRPAVLICPGGGYLYCSDREAEPVAVAFNQKGYHAFVVRYHTYLEEGEDERSSYSEKRTNSMYPQPLYDVAKAMLLIKEHAKEWGIDSEKIVVCGFSAGGHNVSMLATHWNKPFLTDYFQVEAELLKPAAVIVGYMLSDWQYSLQYAHQKYQSLLQNAMLAYFGTTTPTQKELESGSPLPYVSSETPPMFLWATVADQLIPVENTVLMMQRLAKNQVPYEVHLFEEGSHGLSLATASTATEEKHINSHVAKWFDLACEWLDKTLELPYKK